MKFFPKKYVLEDETQLLIDQLAADFPKDFYNDKHVLRVAVIELNKKMRFSE